MGNKIGRECHAKKSVTYNLAFLSSCNNETIDDSDKYNKIRRYLVNFNMYQGSDPKANKDYYKVFGACAAPFVTILDGLPDDKSKLPYKFYCDNLFTSFHLLAHIMDRGFALTGTIRENRIKQTCLIVSKGT
ncbi:hypothetical protein NQ317_015701 [Molorchus minor]|uniref:PiggyBac transposable element-derived protein domain-containing protein n=1 Tax=Molorchus minor TaxID=1323400 RepID=A0ABQ9J5P2_9CUCU|nr:hypothetical protein NQ317_015701 [Molorchus minor]